MAKAHIAFGIWVKNKKYIEMREGMGQLGQWLLITTKKKYGELVGMKNLVFCSCYNVPTGNLYQNLQKR